MKILNESLAWFLLGARFTRLEIYVPLPNTKENSFFPSTIIKWNNLDPHLRKSESFSVFKSNILRFIRPSPNYVYNRHNPRGIYLIVRLRLMKDKLSWVLWVILTIVCSRIPVTFWHKLCFMEIRRLVQVITPRFLMPKSIKSWQLKDLMNSFFNKWR